MTSFIDEHRASYGVESICAMLPIAPSTYYEQKARQADPLRLPKRTQRDAVLCVEIDRVWPREPWSLRFSQGLEAAGPRGHPGRPLYRRAADPQA